MTSSSLNAAAARQGTDFAIRLEEEDEAHLFFDDHDQQQQQQQQSSWPPAAALCSSSSSVTDEYGGQDEDDAEEDAEDADKSAAAPRPTKRRKSSSAGDGEEEGDGEGDEDGGAGGGDDKLKKRRQQIAAASRASRARRKRELDDLRDENKRLREERSQFLGKIGELQMKVEHMRERGSTDMRVENELLRVQLEEHKHFVASFKRLCDGAPASSVNTAKHQIYRQASEAAQAHVMQIIAHSQAVPDGSSGGGGAWRECALPSDIPHSNFSMFYCVVAPPPASGNSGEDSSLQPMMHVRIDVLFPLVDSTRVSDFFWHVFSDTRAHERLFDVKGVELTALAEDTMPDKDTKSVYYRERADTASSNNKKQRDQDWVTICNRRKRDLPSVALPGCASSSSCAQSACTVLAMATATSTTFDTADRITAPVTVGCVSWDQGNGDARMLLVFSLPLDFRIKAVDQFRDVVVEENGGGAISSRMGARFAGVIQRCREMMVEVQNSV